MKTIGLIGGMSWESTVTYYELINKLVKKELGGLHSAKIVLYSVDFHEIEECQSKGDWDKSAEILGEAAKKLERAGAELILICTNTMHKVFSQVREQVGRPLLHIAEASAKKLLSQNIRKVLLLGTQYTMQQDFYKEKLISSGIEVQIPDEEEMKFINLVIFNELCLGKIREESKAGYLSIIEKYANEGVHGVLLACTEIGLLINQTDTKVPVFDTTVIHAEQAVEQALR